MAKNVLIVTPSIRPGGGPPGYVFNLKAGVDSLSESSSLQNNFEFLGSSSTERMKAKVTVGAETALWRLLVSTATRLGLRPIVSRRARAARAAIKRSHVVVVQGFQDTYIANAAKRLGKTVLYMPHSPSVFADEYRMNAETAGGEYEAGEFKRLLRLERQLFEIADAAVFPSIEAKAEYERVFAQVLARKRHYYLRSGVHIEQPEAPPGSGSCARPINVLFAGRYVPHKGYDLFCRAAELLGSQPGLKFVSVGAGPIEAGAKVENLGWRTDVLDVIGSAHLVVIPNRVAYYDLLPLECAALSKPLVMTPVGGNLSQARDLPDVVCSSDVTAEAIAEAISDAALKLQQNPEWGARNATAFRALFGSRPFAARWDQLVTELP